MAGGVGDGLSSGRNRRALIVTPALLTTGQGRAPGATLSLPF
jgi:hypothetical protein